MKQEEMLSYNERQGKHLANKEVIRFFLENIYEIAILCNLQNNGFLSIIDANPNACRFLGYTNNELLQLELQDVLMLGSIACDKQELKYYLQKQHANCEGLVLGKDGLKRYVEIKNYPFEMEEGQQVLLTLKDISKEKQSTNELLHINMLLKRAEAIGKIGYWEYDLETRNFWGSAGARNIYGIGHLELTPEYIQSISLPENREKTYNAFINLIGNFTKYDLEFKICRPSDGSIIDVHSVAEYDAVEKKVFGLIQDITEQKKVETELITAKNQAEESNRLKAAFLSNLSHEIRTPMNGIVGFTELITQPNLSQDTLEEFKELINQSCNNLLGVITDILDISKIETAQITVDKKPVQISKVLNEMLELYEPTASKKNLVFCLNSKNLPVFLEVNTDEEKLKRVITIIIDNAIEFTSNGYVEFGCIMRDTYLEFYVKDSGIGIADNEHDIIFERFTQANAEISQNFGGTGLGLAISKSFISILGGSIWVNSKLGEGSTFYFTIPHTINTPNNSDKKEIASTNQSNMKTCLIVDDFEMNYIYLKAILKPAGYNILWAKDGNEAIKMSTDESINIVLMDLKMPNINGYEATKIIKSARPNLPIIAQTACALLDEKNRAMAAGCDDYITKPINKVEFLKKVSLLMN